MPTVLLVRHAENDYIEKHHLAGRIPEVHLNENGRKQANALTELLKNIPIRAIYSSPLERARETIERTAEFHRVPVTVRDELNEVDYGEWQGQSLKSLRKQPLWKTVQQRPSLTEFPNGETFSEAQQRACGWIIDECDRYKPRDIFLCVSHCDLIKLVVAYFIGLPLDQFQRLNVDTASISALHISPKRDANLIFLNRNVPSLVRKRQDLVY